MNVYDFDGTIYSGDSSLDFWRFCLRKNFSLARFLPKQIFFVAKFAVKKIPRKEFKEQFFSFLNGIGEAELHKIIAEFWRHNEKKIKPWYFSQKAGDDIIISAGPEFLLASIAAKLGAHLIATKMDFRTGKISGENCRGQEKVRRFFEFLDVATSPSAFQKPLIENFYSDSKSDEPLASISQKAFLVRGKKIVAW